MDNMLDDTRYTFGEVYAFINDRFRAISKSLTVQVTKTAVIFSFISIFFFLIKIFIL